MKDKIEALYQNFTTDISQKIDISSFDILVQLERVIVEYIKLRQKTQLELLETLNKTDDNWRKENIQKVVKDILGVDKSLDEMADDYISRLTQILDNKTLSWDEKCKQLGVHIISIDKVITPPDPDLAPITGSGTGWEKKICQTMIVAQRSSLCS